MNKLTYIIIVAFLAITLGAYSQTESAIGTPEANFSILQNKLKKSTANLSNEKKSSSPKFWLSRGELLMEIFNLHREFLAQGTQEIHVKLIYPNPLETKEWVDDEGIQWQEMIFEKIKIKMKNGLVDSFEELVKLHEDPLADALTSLKKAQELDVDNKLDKKLKEDFLLLKQYFERQAIEQYFLPDYKSSFHSFATINEIAVMPIAGGVVDTTYLYYAGMAASKAKMTEESITYYEKALSYNYPEPDIFVFLKEKYYSLGDTIKGVESLEKGFELYPEHQAIVIELINYYLTAGRGEEALEYLMIAQKDDPENLSFLFAEATLHDKMGNTDKALATYQKCLDLDPTYFNAYYNIGVMYYNNAVEMYKAADDIKDRKKYDIAKDAADEILEKSLPFMESAHEIDPNEPSTMETLKTLYYRMQMTDKYEEIKGILEEVPEKEEEDKGMSN